MEQFDEIIELDLSLPAYNLNLVDAIKSEEEIRIQMGYGAISAIKNLSSATIVVGISLTFPLQILLTYVYCKLTKRIFTLRTSNIFDICIFFTVVVWFYKMNQYENDLYSTKGTEKGFTYWKKEHKF